MTTKEKQQTLDEIESEFTIPPESISAEPVYDENATAMELYGMTVDRVQALEGKCRSLDVPLDDKETYAEAKRTRRFLQKIRTTVEKRRLLANAEDQSRIKFRNGIAKKIITYIEELENPIYARIKFVDEAAEREKRAAEEAEAARIEAERQAFIESERARMKAEADKLAAERAALEAERKRMDELLAAERAKAAEQQRLEQERLDKIRREEQERLDRQRAAAEASQRAAQERIDAENLRLEAERKVIEDAKREAERIEFEKQAKIKAEKEAAEKVERDRIAAEAAAKAKAEADEKERQRIEAMRPDVERLKVFAQAIRKLSPPLVSSLPAQTVLAQAVERLGKTAAALEAFKP